AASCPSGDTTRDARALFTELLFFFQAEDGIRDLIVTGVQTCALPISSRCLLAAMKVGRVCQRCQKASRCSKRSSSGVAFTGNLEIGRASCRERVEISGAGV